MRRLISLYIMALILTGCVAVPAPYFYSYYGSYHGHGRYHGHGYYHHRY